MNNNIIYHHQKITILFSVVTPVDFKSLGFQRMVIIVFEYLYPHQISMSLNFTMKMPTFHFFLVFFCYGFLIQIEIVSILILNSNIESHHIFYPNTIGKKFKSSILESNASVD